MSQKQIASLSGIVVADDGSSANSLVLRDASNDVYAAIMRGSAGVRSSGHLYLGVASSQTISFALDESTYNGTLYPCNAASGALTVTLPAASASTNKVVGFIKTDAVSNVIIDGNGSETISGALNLVLYRQYDSVMLACDGTGWHVIGPKPSVIYTSTADSTAVSNTATETAFDKFATIAANTLVDGQMIRVRGFVNVTTGNSSDTLTLKLKIGASIGAGVGTTIIATAAVDVTDGGGDEGYFDALIQVRVSGASGTFVATGVQALGVPGTVTAKPFFKASTSVDWTVAQIIGVSATWSASSSSDSCKLSELVVEFV